MSGNKYETDPAQLAVAIGYSNKNHIADKIMPRVSVGKKNFKYSQYDIEGVFNIPNDDIAHNASPNHLTFGSKRVDGSVQDRGYKSVISNDDADEAVKSSMPNPVNRATLKIRDAVARRREMRVMAKVFGAENYEHKDTLVGATFLNNPDVHAIQYLLDALNAPLERPNLMTIGKSAWASVRTAPSIVRAYNGTLGEDGAVSRQWLADQLEIDEILVGMASVNIAKPGLAPDIQPIWGNSVSFTVRAPVVDVDDTITWGFTAQYGGWVTGHRDSPDAGLRGAREVKAGESVGEIVCAKAAGFLIEDATGVIPE